MVERCNISHVEKGIEREAIQPNGHTPGNSQAPFLSIAPATDTIKQTGALSHSLQVRRPRVGSASALSVRSDSLSCTLSRGYNTWVRAHTT